MNLKSLPTTIGSLPFLSPDEAVDLTLKTTPELPAWPQLSKRSFKENMYVQFSENFPGIVLDEKNQKIYVDIQEAYSELEKFYENFLANNLDYFSISQEYASGFRSLLSKLSTLNSKLISVKCQTTGPLTFGLAVKDENGQSIFYNEQLRDTVIKHITMKSIWQLRQFLTMNHELSTMILFLDEPYLAAYGSAFTAISREDIINSLQEVITGIKSSFNSTTLPPLHSNSLPLHHSITLLTGVHCCANTDWSLLLDTDIDILSFDAYEFFDNLLLYFDKLKRFVDRGGILAFGIVPTNEEALKKENTDSLVNLLNKQIDTLSNKGIEKSKLIEQLIITPACGFGSRTEETAKYALNLLSKIANKLHE